MGNDGVFGVKFFITALEVGDVNGELINNSDKNSSDGLQGVDVLSPSIVTDSNAKNL